MNDIPQSVIQEAKGLIDLFGNTLKYLGELWGYAVYMFVFPDNMVTGYPFVFLYDNENETVDAITGYDAVDIIGKLME